MSEESLRERKKVATRALIARVADKLFLEKGFEVVALEEVAEACNVSVRTILRYFETKEALALSHEYTLSEQFRTGLANRSGDVLSYWEEYTRALATDVASRPGWYRLRLAALRPLPLWLRIIGIEREHQLLLAKALAEEGNDGNSLRPYLLAAALVTSNETVVGQWVASSRRDFDPAVMLEAVSYVLSLFSQDPLETPDRCSPIDSERITRTRPSARNA